MLRDRFATAKTASRRAAAVVEFAVVAPVMFLLVFGMIEYGRAIMVGQVAVSASREGCREAVLASSTVSDVRNFTIQYMQAAGIAADAVTVQVAQDSGGGSFVTTSDLSSVSQGTSIRVMVVVEFEKASFIPPMFIPDGTTVQGATVMRKESS